WCWKVHSSQAGILRSLEQDAAYQSVIPCGDDSVVTVKGDKKYKGVLHCTQCQAPSANAGGEAVSAVCNTCENGFFVQTTGNTKTCEACDGTCKTCSGIGTNKCTACTAETHFLASTTTEGPCVSCGTVQSTWSGVANCAKCTKPIDQNTPAVCTECADSYYLKTATGATPPSCVGASECGKGLFPTTVSNVKTCISCSTTVNGGITDCSECSLLPSASRSSTVLVTCTKCGSDKYLKTAADGTTTCVEKTACKDDFFPVDDPTNGNKCISCGDETSGVPNCAKCTAPTTTGQKPTCSECTSGYKLEGETCVSSSTNKSGLSTGAIAGISVAAVVVVGGLVGFLCWWYTPRGATRNVISLHSTVDQ
ncbi:Variant-specific surface protein, partial [Giardia duodenalis]